MALRQNKSTAKWRLWVVGAVAAAAAVVIGVSLTSGPGTDSAATAAQPAAAAPAIAAAAATPVQDAAVAWARGQIGADAYVDLCLQFVYDAYLTGAATDIGVAPSAIDWWNAHPDLQHLGDVNPPAGALVFWNATATNPYGHVAIAEGGDLVISSAERTTSVIHEYSLTDRNNSGAPYLGWIQPV